MLFWASDAPRPARALRGARPRARALTRAGIAALAIAIDAPGTCRRSAPRPRAPALPVVLASDELALSYAILNRHLFMNRQDLRLPTAFLLDADGRS